MADSQEIADREAFYDSLVVSQVNGVYVYDLTLGRNVYISPRYTELTGYTRDEINRLDAEAFGELFHAEDREQVFAHMGEVAAAADDRRIPLEYRFRRKGGGWVWLFGHDVPIERDAEGRVTRFMGSFVDITAQKTVQRDLEEFARFAAHDLREPARRIRMLSQVLREEITDTADAEVLGLLESVSVEAGRLDALVNDLRAITRVGSGQAPVSSRRSPAEVGLEVARAVGVPEIEADAHPEVECYASLLAPLYGNLVQNARRYGGPDARIRLTAEQGADGWTFGVHNTGSTLTVTERDQVFLPFRRFSERAGGSGLGLAICRRVVEYHGGRIWAESGPDWVHVRFTLGQGAETRP